MSSYVAYFYFLKENGPRFKNIDSIVFLNKKKVMKKEADIYPDNQQKNTIRI